MTDHPDVLDEELDEILLEAINEGWFLRSKTDYPNGFTGADVSKIIEKQKTKLKSHYRSVEEIEAALPDKKKFDREEQYPYEQRIIGYNIALDDIRKALGLEG